MERPNPIRPYNTFLFRKLLFQGSDENPKSGSGFGLLDLDTPDSPGSWLGLPTLGETGKTHCCYLLASIWSYTNFIFILFILQKKRRYYCRILREERLRSQCRFPMHSISGSDVWMFWNLCTILLTMETLLRSRLARWCIFTYIMRAEKLILQERHLWNYLNWWLLRRGKKFPLRHLPRKALPR